LMLFIAISSLTLLQNCGDKPQPKVVCDSTNTAFLPQELLDRFYFKNGTWWVYMDIIAGIKDSIWIVRTSFDIFEEPELKKNCEQIADYNYKTNISDNWLVSISPQSIAGNKKLTNVRYTIFYRNTNKNASIYRFDFINGSYQNPTEEGGSVSFQDSLIVKSKVFKDILHLEYQQKPLPPEIIKQAWYAKHFGLIKYENWDGKIWELTNYHINQ